VPPSGGRVVRDRGPRRSRQDQYQPGNVNDTVAELYEAHRAQAAKARLDKTRWNRGIQRFQEANAIPLPMDVDHDEL